MHPAVQFRQETVSYPFTHELQQRLFERFILVQLPENFSFSSLTHREPPFLGYLNSKHLTFSQEITPFKAIVFKC